MNENTYNQGIDTYEEDKKQLKDILLSKRDFKRLTKLNKRWRNVKSGKLKGNM